MQGYATCFFESVGKYEFPPKIDGSRNVLIKVRLAVGIEKSFFQVKISYASSGHFQMKEKHSACDQLKRKPLHLRLI